jgi:DNA polymerase III delta subunit
MNPYEQIKALAELKERPLKVLIVCPDSIRKERALDHLLLAIGSPQSLTKIEASTLNAQAVSRLRDGSMNLSLFHSESTYVLKNLDDCPAAIGAELVEIISSKKAFNNFICHATSLNQKSWINKAFKKSEIISFEKLEAEELIKWTGAELRRAALGKTSAEVARLISAICDDDCDKIAATIEKLRLLSDSDQISMQDLKQFDGLKEKAQEFHFINLLAQNKKTQALSYLKTINSASTSAFPLLSLTAKMLSNYLGIKIAQRAGLSAAEVQKSLAMSPWAYKKQLETASSVNEVKLLRAIKALARADSQLKNKNLGEQSILTEMIANV